MPQEINPKEIPVATHIQITSFEVNPELLIGKVCYQEGIMQDGEFVPLKDSDRAIREDEMLSLMSKVPEGVTLYDAIKAELYALILPPDPAPLEAETPVTEEPENAPEEPESMEPSA